MILFHILIIYVVSRCLLFVVCYLSYFTCHIIFRIFIIFYCRVFIFIFVFYLSCFILHLIYLSYFFITFIGLKACYLGFSFFLAQNRPIVRPQQPRPRGPTARAQLLGTAQPRPAVSFPRGPRQACWLFPQLARPGFLLFLLALFLLSSRVGPSPFGMALHFIRPALPFFSPAQGDVKTQDP